MNLDHKTHKPTVGRQRPNLLDFQLALHKMAANSCVTMCSAGVEDDGSALLLTLILVGIIALFLSGDSQPSKVDPTPVTAKEAPRVEVTKALRAKKPAKVRSVRKVGFAPKACGAVLY